MKGMAAVLAVMMAATGCSPAAGPAQTPSPTATPVTPNFERYVGAYQTADGITFVVNGHGHLLNLQDSTFRQLFPTATADRFTTGRAFAVPTPIESEVRFRMVADRADQMTITATARPGTVATRLLFKESEVRVPVNGAELAGTITEPLTPGPHPGIVIVHGSGPGPRIDYGIWVGLYAYLGLTVLAYDKRGNGASTGQYPGEFASDANLDIYAGDAAAMLRFLTTWPGIDPNRVGFHAGSQGGWVAPLAIGRFQAPAAFAIMVSCPAVTVDQQGVWASFSNGSMVTPSESAADMDQQVRQTTSSGYVPATLLPQIRQPMLWFNGAVDHQVPTTVNAEILRSLHHANWEIDIAPGVDHGLFENPSGLEPDEPKASKLAVGLWDKIAVWLRQNAITR
jgi:dienelactone hydrolase